MRFTRNARNSTKAEITWGKIEVLFDRLLDGEDLARVLASEPDAQVRSDLEKLWSHHHSASEENFLEEAVNFEVLPMFQPGETLQNGRFRIERMLGSGGMGEVYLAYDRTLHDQVALKTVARLLTPSQAIRERIAEEVRTARRVTHSNVCRIHELYNEGDRVFFVMEFVEGSLLSDLLQRPVPAELAQTLVLQMAQGLHAAQRNKVVHGDFKPSNVMVVPGEKPRAVIMDFGLAQAFDRTGMWAESAAFAGTAKYMAPELLAGGSPSYKSDIYAFGQVALKLLPGEHLLKQCIASDPEMRPVSLDAIVRRLQPGHSRRLTLVTASLGVAAVAGFSYWGSSRQGGGLTLALPRGARLLVNGFSAEEGMPVARPRLLRALLLTALQQSPKIRAIADIDLLSAVKAMGAALPLAGAALKSVLTSMRASFWMDANLHAAGDRYSLHVRVFQASGIQVGETHIQDVPSVANLAEQAALWVRSAAGETRQSFQANPADVPSYTSQVSEALEKYYDAMEFFAVAQTKLAVPLLEEAIRLDPNFAQAHCSLGMMFNTSGRYDEAYREVELAWQLSSGLPERERANIESKYAFLCSDPIRMVETARRNVDYYPDEPRFLRVLANMLVQAGLAPEAIQHNRKAVEMSSNSELQRTELINNLCEAGQFETALQEFELIQAQGLKLPYTNRYGGLACLGLERYDEALAHYAREVYQLQPGNSDKTFNLQRVNVMQGKLDSVTAAMREVQAAPEGIARLHAASEFLCGAYFLSDRLPEAREQVLKMAALPVVPSFARRLDCAAFWAARLGDDETLAKVHGSLGSIASRWPNSYTQSAERHAGGLQALRRGDNKTAETLLLQASGGAFNIWAMFDLADFCAARVQYGLAEDYWQRIEDFRGVILARWFPGVLLMAWVRRALAAEARRDEATALLYSRKVVKHWGYAQPQTQIVQLARTLSKKNST